MNPKQMMTSSAAALILTGIALSFLPQEIGRMLPSGSEGVPPIILQILGALYFAFGMVNWTARENLIGGIYGRPIAIGNMTHFVIGALALIKNIMNDGSTPVLLAATVVYTSFALQFSVIFFRQPTKQQ